MDSSRSRLLAAAFPIYPETVLYENLAYGAPTMHLTRVYVSVARRLTEVFSIDPGEFASNALGRLMGSTSLAIVARRDGGLRLKEIVTNRLEMPQWEIPGASSSASRKIDLMAPSHIRFTTATDERDVFIAQAQAVTFAHFFEKMDEPNVISAAEILAGEIGIIAKVRRGMDAVEIGAPYCPLLEVDDTIGVDLDTRLLDSVSVQMSTESGAPVFSARYQISDAPLLDPHYTGGN